MSDIYPTSVLACALARDPAVVRTIASALPMESRVKHRIQRAHTLRDALSIVVADALCASLPRRVACDIVSAAAPHFEAIVAVESLTPWTIVHPETASPTGFAFRFFLEADDALVFLRSLPSAGTINWRDLVRGALVRLVEAQRQVKEDRFDA